MYRASKFTGVVVCLIERIVDFHGMLLSFGEDGTPSDFLFFKLKISNLSSYFEAACLMRIMQVILLSLKDLYMYVEECELVYFANVPHVEIASLVIPSSINNH